MSAIRLLLFLHAVGTATSFSAPKTTTSSAPWQNFLDSFFSSPSPNAAPNSNSAATALKKELITECRQSVGRNTPEIRQRIEVLMDQLAPLNPTPKAATSPLLQRRWILEWTSEKEINFFLDKGLSRTGAITQTLDGDVLENDIPFVGGGGFGVTGRISVDEEREGLARTDFEFRTANLDLGKWGEYKFPPVGKGWFDTIYLDQGLRIDTNSRDDILICRADV